jgi:CHASE3 domain sensor protein
MRASGFTAGRWLGLSVGVLALAALLAIVLAFVAASRLSDARNRLVDQVDPAQAAVLTLQSAVVNQETAVRGFLLGGRETFLRPYTLG